MLGYSRLLSRMYKEALPICREKELTIQMCCFSNNHIIHLKTLGKLQSPTRGWYFMISRSSGLKSRGLGMKLSLACGPEAILKTEEWEGVLVLITDLWSLQSFIPYWFFSLTYLPVWVLVLHPFLHSESYHRHRCPTTQTPEALENSMSNRTTMWRSLIQNEPQKNQQGNFDIQFW